MAGIQVKRELLGPLVVGLAVVLGLSLSMWANPEIASSGATAGPVSACSPPVADASPPVADSSPPVANASPPCVTDTANFNAVIQIDPSPSFAGDPVFVSSSQLQGTCASVTYETLQGGSPAAPRFSANNITVILDSEGNASLVVNAVDCAPGKDLVETSMTVAPFLTATTSVVLEPPAVTAPGVAGYPANEVETGTSTASGDSDVYTVFYVETSPVYAEQPVEISSPQLTGRCLRGSRWESNGAGTPFVGSPTATATIDDDGNAVFVFKGESCAAGASTVIADVLAGSHPTYTTTYSIVAPQPIVAGTMQATSKGAGKKRGGKKGAGKKHHRHQGSSPATPAPMNVTVSPNPLILVGN